MEKINILWTGGWDSTFRILNLINKQITIQPYYLKDNRKSETIELKTIEKIGKIIREHPKTKCTLLESISMYVSDIPKDMGITKAYNNMLKTDFYGSQYDWLARFAKTDRNMELTIHQDDKAFSIIKKYGDVIETHDNKKGNYYILDKEKSSEDLIKVFGNYHFPILGTSKLEMKKWAINKGYIDIMNATWFCHHPKNNKPCGICNPCIYTIEEGLDYRFSKKALLMYKLKKTIKPNKQSLLYKLLKIWI